MSLQVGFFQGGGLRVRGRVPIPVVTRAPGTVQVSRLRVAAAVVATPPPAGDAFVLGTTAPYVANSDSPGSNAADNVGAGLGFNPALNPTPLTGVVTVNAGETLRDRIINGTVVLNGGTIENCVITGLSPASASYTGVVNVKSGGTIRFCTIRPSVGALTYTQNSQNVGAYFLNAFTITGNGVTAIHRCDWSHIVDGVHVGSGDHVEVTGNFAHHYSLFTNDPTHSSDSAHPGWGHADVLIQRNPAGSGVDLIRGNNAQAFFDTEAVTWSGGQPGSGTASGGKWGFGIADALNQGFVNTNPASPNYGLGTYANSASWTNVSGNQAEIASNWFNGVSATSSQIQFTVSPNTVKLYGNRFGLGGQPTSGGRFYLVTASVLDTTGDPNVFFGASDRYAADVPAQYRGQPIPATSSTQFAITP